MVSRVERWWGGSLSSSGSTLENTASYPLAPAHTHTHTQYTIVIILHSREEGEGEGEEGGGRGERERGRRERGEEGEGEAGEGRRGGRKLTSSFNEVIVKVIGHDRCWQFSKVELESGREDTWLCRVYVHCLCIW